MPGCLRVSSFEDDSEIMNLQSPSKTLPVTVQQSSLMLITQTLLVNVLAGRCAFQHHVGTPRVWGVRCPCLSQITNPLNSPPPPRPPPGVLAGAGLLIRLEVPTHCPPPAVPWKCGSGTSPGRSRGASRSRNQRPSQIRKEEGWLAPGHSSPDRRQGLSWTRMYGLRVTLPSHMEMTRRLSRQRDSEG